MTWKDMRLTGKFALGFGIVLLLLSGIAGWSIVGITNIVDDAREVIDGNALRAEMIQREVDHLNWAGSVNALLTDAKVTRLEVQTDPHKCAFGRWYFGAGRRHAEQLIPALKATLDRIEEPHRKLHESAVEIARVFHQADTTLPEFLAEKETDHLAWANSILTVFAENKSALEVQTDPHRCGLGSFLDSTKAQQVAASDPELKHLLQEIAAPHAHLHASAAEIGRNLGNRSQAYAIFRNQTIPALRTTQTLLKQLKQRSEELVEGMQAANAIYASQTLPNLNRVQELLHETIETADKNIMTDRQMLDAARATRAGTVTLAGIALPLGIFFAVLIARGIINPMKKSGLMMQELEKGHLDMRLKLDRGDEIGQMARSMDAFADSLEAEMIGSLQKLAAGDLTFSVTPRDSKDVVRGALMKLRRDLGQLIVEIQTAGEQIASGSLQVADNSQTLAQGATESASSLEQISASMVEMASQTKLNAENAEQANRIVNQSKSAAEIGNQRMQQMVAAMNEIKDASQDISKIIKVIDDIAFQTNLLALNAAVEAARAGQHGKGFAVVAEEVRDLAARSARAARETAELIEGSVGKVEGGARIATETETALHEIVEGIVKISGLVGEIAAASGEQSQGIGQINQGLDQIDTVTQQNTASAEESAATAEELSGQADQLRHMLTRFKLDGQQAKPTAVAPITETAGGGKGFSEERPAIDYV